MNKCFITKLPSSIDNDNLPVLGQLRINWLKESNLTNKENRAIGLSTNDNITVNVSGAHFTDNTLTSNLGNTKTITAADNLVWLYISNDSDAVITIDNKYSLTALDIAKESVNSTRPIYFDIEDIKYCTNINHLRLSYSQVSGDISALSNLINLTHIFSKGTLLYGDISALSNLTKLRVISLIDNKISGDISALSNLTNLQEIYLKDSQVNGDISALSNLTKLNTIDFSNTNVVGDISALSNLTKLNTIDFSNTNVVGDISALINLNLKSVARDDWSWVKEFSLTGDMSKIPANVYFITQSGRKVNTNFTWTANGRQNATLLAMAGNIPFDTTSMDNMLIDQATCTFRPIDSFEWTKIISVKGTRTAASDAAVTAIQNMGVTITGVTKQA